MRTSADLTQLAVALRDPMREFVAETHVLIALLINGSGQVLAQHGFTRGYELVNVAALAAAANASSRMLAQLSGLVSWRHMHHAGKTRELFLAPVSTPSEEVVLVAVFDAESSLGLVQVFASRLAVRLGALPEFQVRVAPTDVNRFEKDLEAGLSRVFPAAERWGS